ncbi:MAG TPA: phospholipase C, phosphocholine-specific, partial [Micromonosporaceae bacterium]|nr:phospholipase C, phosphocholine-specific [Micromonosporaceae bacterium]
TRNDIPFHYALADAFTVCDAYHCSFLGPTDPNRYHMWTGWVGNDGKAGGPVITNAEAGYDWSTYPERLERAGISWRVYQDSGIGLDAAGSWGWTGDPYIGNFGDNSLLYFHQYQNAAPGTPLADKAKTGTAIVGQNRDPEALLTDFRDDVRNGNLPAVSWIVAPEAYCEHPNWEPDFGAWYVSQVVDILADNPDVWGRMALFITYDEEGGFFDHLVPPTPPQTPAQGRSTAPTTNEIFPGTSDHPAGPYGLGVRVPMLVVSPWTRGGWVNSQLFDHTSLIRFLETRFAAGNADLIESNITPWRRAVVGDLTGAFDFRTPNNSRHLPLPDTDRFKPEDLTRQPDQVPVPPADPALPKQERGVRPARPLPYDLNVDGHIDGDTLTVDFANPGGATGVFHVQSAALDPRSYTVEPGKRLSDGWESASGHDVSVFGPNGFFRRFTGIGRGPRVRVRTDARQEQLVVEFENTTSTRFQLSVADRYRSQTVRLSLRPGETASRHWSLARTMGWYDLTVTADGRPDLAFQFAGHLENGKDSFSDPGMGGLV